MADKFEFVSPNHAHHVVFRAMCRASTPPIWYMTSAKPTGTVTSISNDDAARIMGELTLWERAMYGTRQILQEQLQAVGQ